MFKKILTIITAVLSVLILASCGKTETETYAYDKAVEMGYAGTQEEFLAALVGENIEGEESAYALAVENGFSGTQEEWFSVLEINITTTEE